MTTAMFSPLTWMNLTICSTGGMREVEKNSVPRSQVCWITIIIIMVVLEVISMIILVVIMIIVVIITPGTVPASRGAPVVASLPPVSQLWGLGADVGLWSPSRVWRSPISPVRSPPMAVGLLDRSKGVRRGARHAGILHLRDFSMNVVLPLRQFILHLNNLRYHCHRCCTHLNTEYLQTKACSVVLAFSDIIFKRRHAFC